VLKGLGDRLPRLSHLWVDAGYQGRGKEWAENVLGLIVEAVHRRPKPTPEKVARMWAEEWSREGWQIDWQKLLPRRGFEVLPRRWVVERTFSWLSQIGGQAGTTSDCVPPVRRSSMWRGVA
jgi:transposase